jgi:hypothetical protein
MVRYHYHHRLIATIRVEPMESYQKNIKRKQGKKEESIEKSN